MTQQSSTEKYLGSIFSRSTAKLCDALGNRSNVAGTPLHAAQTEFSYMIRPIIGGASDHARSKFVSKIERLCSEIEAFVEAFNDAGHPSVFVFPIDNKEYSYSQGSWKRTK